MVKLQVRLPDSLHRTAKRLARQQETSLNQFLVTAAFHEALSRVPDVAPERRDRLPRR